MLICVMHKYNKTKVHKHASHTEREGNVSKSRSYIHFDHNITQHHSPGQPTLNLNLFSAFILNFFTGIANWASDNRDGNVADKVSVTEIKYYFIFNIWKCLSER